MLGTITNQPINFTASPVIVDCPDKRVPLIAAPDDVLRFQVIVEPAAGAYGSAIRDWLPGEDWGGPGAWVSVDGGGVCAPSAAPGGYIEPIASTFFPTIGTTYTIEIDVVSITGLVEFSMGGQVVVLSMPGLQSITITAATAAAPRITLVNASSRTCINRIRLFELLAPSESLGCSVIVEIMDAESGDPVETITTVTRPELFTLAGNVLGVAVPLGEYDDLPPCIFLRASSACDDQVKYICSQPIALGVECKGTILVRACLDHDALGFAAPAIFEARLRASLVRPRWESDSSDERWSDGTINRYYADRQRIMDLMIQPIDEALHPFIATLWMFDHVYIDGTEYIVDADGGEPAYGDQTGTAAVSLTVRPKRELLRRVNCDAPGTGCAPSTDPQCAPPNVQYQHYYDCDGGGYFLEVIVYSALGFVPDRIIITEDGEPFDMETWSTPTSYLFGPFALSSLIGIEVTNANEPACDWSAGIQLPMCEGPGFGRFATVSLEEFDVILGTMAWEPQWAALRQVSGSGLGEAIAVATGEPGYEVPGDVLGREFCFYGCADPTSVPLEMSMTVDTYTAPLAQVGTLNGKPLYYSPNWAGSGQDAEAYWDSGVWTVNANGQTWTSSEDVITPDLVTSWTGPSPEPSFTPSAQFIAGAPLDTLTDVILQRADLLWIDVTHLCWLGVLSAQDGFLTSIDLSGNPNLAIVSLARNDLTSIVWPPGPMQLTYAEFADNPNLSVLPTLDPALVAESMIMGFTGCALTADSIAMIIASCYASGQLYGDLDFAGGTNAALPVSGPVFDMIDELMNSRGWQVLGN